MTTKLYNLTKEKVEIHKFGLEAGNQALLFTCHEGTAKEESVTIILSPEQIKALRASLQREEEK